MDARDVFEILAREHADSLMAYLRAVVEDAAAADDLFQETLVVAWRRIDDFDRRRPFGPWLRGIAAKLVLAWRRQQAGQDRLCDAQTLEHLDQRLSQVQRLTGDTLDEKLAALADCLTGMPDSFREAIQLRYQDEVRPQELANRLQVSAEALKKRLQRARAMLLECIQAKLTAAGGAS
ncbi:MAG: sigma-70 family RNA polymerase sigma factor [Pirellulales bacterium]